MATKAVWNLLVIVAITLVIGLSNANPHGGGGVVLVPGVVAAPVAPVVPVVPVAPYYAIPKRCARRPHKCNYYYGHPHPPPPPPPPPPRPYYGHYGHGGPAVGVAAVGVGVVVGK